MLVLTRKRGESIRITIPAGSADRTILVHLLEHSGEPRLGFEADRDITILRTEIVDRGPRS